VISPRRVNWDQRVQFDGVQVKAETLKSVGGWEIGKEITCAQTDYQNPLRACLMVLIIVRRLRLRYAASFYS
jgi:hypothetical protein